jgi:hypothetical protein
MSCLPKRVIPRQIEGKRDGTKTHERRRKQLLDDFQETQENWNLKDRTLWRTCFRKGYGRLRKTEYRIKNHITVTTL